MDQSKTIKFVVPQFSKLENELLSSRCYINNVPWQILVKPCTSPTRTLGFFLECNGGSEFPFWAYYAKAELKLLSVRPNVKPFSRKMQQFFCSGRYSCGWEEFISWKDVLKGFIRHDTITLEVHISESQDLLQTIRYRLPKDVVEEVVCQFKLSSSKGLFVEEFVQILLNIFDNTKIKTVLDAKKKQNAILEQTNKILTKDLEVQQRNVEELTVANHELETVKKNLEKQVAVLNEQLTDAKKKADEGAVFEESEKKLMKDLEAQQRQIEEFTVENDVLEMNEKKITAELEDANIELETQGSKVDELENKLENLKILTEEKATKKDIFEEKESKVSSISQGSQGTADKNVVVEIEKVKTVFENQLTEFKAQNGKLENELQLTKDAKLSFEVNMQALSQSRDSQVQKEQAVAKHREINNHWQDMEAELDEERKQCIAAVTFKWNLEGNLKGMESYVEHLCKVKKDTFKQLEKLQQQCQEATSVAEEAQTARNELTAKNKDAERKLKTLEIELSQVSKDLTNSEHARKAAEAERDGFQEEINSRAYECSLLISEKRQLEARIATLEEELEGKQNNNDTLAEKLRETVEKNLEKQVAALNEQLTDVQKKADEAAVFEENEKKLMKDLEAQQRRIEELTAANDELKMSKKNITAELEDANIKLQALSCKFRALEVQKEQAVEKHRDINNHLQDVEAELDEERKQRIAAVTSKRKLEGNLKGMESYVEYLCKVKEDYFKQLEKLQLQCQEPTWVAEEAQAARNELTAKNKDAERKLKILEIELSQVSKDLTNSEHARKAAEAERDGFQEEINSSAYECSLLMSEKCQLEARIATLEEELEEKQNNNDTLAEKLREAKVNVESSYFELIKTKTTIAAFESKVRNLQEQLEVEAKERFAQQKTNRKLEKNLRELAIQLEGERRHADHYKEQLKKVSTSVKALKCQLNGAKDEICREKAQRQKAQREYEGILVPHESLIQENSILKEKLRRITGGSIFSSSICSSKRGSIQSSENGFGDNLTTQNENPYEDDDPS